MKNKTKAKGSRAPKVLKKKSKMGKEKTERHSFFSKKKSLVFKQPTKEVAASKSMSKEVISPKANKTKNMKIKSEEQAKQVKERCMSLTGSTFPKSSLKSMKRRDILGVKNVTVSKLLKEDSVVLETVTKSNALKGKKQKKNCELASGVVSAVGSVARDVAAAPRLASGVGSGGPARLAVACGFSWETTSWPQAAPTPGGDDSNDDEDSQQQPAARLSRQQLRELAVIEERQLVERERRLMDTSREPETADDHERLVVAHPDDSSLWIKFMSYFLQATEIEKARGVARRALKTINFREEDEKLNIYVAWLNLESMHGTQETLGNILREALQSSDTFKVFTRMAEIHQANNKHDEAELMYSQMVKKLPARKEAWLRYGVFLMQVERQEAARAVMQRALKCLERRDHVEVISKFAQLEFRFGEAERGKTMFDHLLATYPKRLDQWNVYLGQLIKTFDFGAARLVFQRAATVQLNARRVRSLLKRFLEFEEAHGTVQQQEAVRELARRYVDARSDADTAALDGQTR